MKQLFHINNQNGDVSQSNILLAEAGEDYCCFAKCNQEAKTINELEYHTFSKFNFDECIASLFENMKANATEYDKVVFCATFPQALLTPLQFYNEENSKDLLNAMYDTGNSRIMQDEIAGWQMINLYAIPHSFYELGTSHFSTATFIHIYTTVLKTYNEFTFDSQIAINFTTTNFRVKVKKNQQLLLMQTFTYTTPLDVIYVLLKICTELHLRQEDTHVILAGLIEENSALYKELYNYFLHVHFATFSNNSLQQQQYPQHFFSSLYNLAACVL